MAFKDPAGIYKTTYEQDFAILRTKAHWGILLAALLLLFSSAAFLPADILGLMTSMGSIIIATLGIQIMLGYAGQVSVGHSGFLAVGAYAGALLMSKLHFPFFLAVLGAGFVSGTVGLIVGAPALRLEGFYIAMCTLAGNMIIIYVLMRWTSLTGGTFGCEFPVGSFLGFSLANERNQFLFAMLVLVISTYAATNLMRTMTGRTFIAVRDNDLAANVMGINVWVTKLKAFFLGCFFAGVGGALWGHWAGFLTPNLFPFMLAIWFLGYIIIGGMGTIEGCYIGVILLIGLRELLARLLPLFDASYSKYLGPTSEAFFGLLIILILIYEPRGIAHRLKLITAWYKVWPLARYL